MNIRCTIMLSDKGVDEELQWLEFEKFPIWEACGADRGRLREIASRSGGPLFEPDGRNGWATGFMREGDRLMDRARSPAIGDLEKADLYDQAALYYGIAKMPSAETPAKRQAYQRQRKALAEAGPRFPFTFRREEIPLGDRKIVGYYYEPGQPREITRPEAVLLTGGADVTKEDVHAVALQIVRDGMACLSVDMPGTGESEWKLRPPGTDNVYDKAIKYLAGRGDDPGRIGMMGLGFGGYWAIASAATCPELKAAVNCGGPVHRTFSHESLKKLPGYYKLALSSAMGYDPADFDKALGILGEFSLLKCVDLRRIDIPLLSVNGSNDPVVPIEDLFIIAEEGGVKQDEWVFQEDGHCAPHRFPEWMPRAVDWLANRLGGRDRMPRPDIVQL
ncbi:MAG: fermentation/respiration switch protein [Methanocella sp. PtaU1.Bin125]|nr:MAG: fermentation/respiration switch protein [Methanocella sp. PtaU1.Bin125]